MKLRSQLALSGLVGVLGGVLLTVGILWLQRRIGLPPLVTGLWTWALLAVLLLFSLAEIPLMIFGMRHMIGSPSGTRLAVLTNGVFTFFAAVYATPFLLLTHRRVVGLMLAGLCLVRYVGALLLVKQSSVPRTSGIR
jgi:hypothetical protein